MTDEVHIHRRSGNAVRNTLVPALLLAAAAMLVAVLPAGASAKQSTVVIPKISATKGHKVTIIAGSKNGKLSPAHGSLAISKGASRNVYWPVKAKVTAKKVNFKLGARGSVKLKFKKTGQKKIKVPKRCKGKAGKQLNGVFTGKVKFKGEKGFAKVKGKQKVKGYVYHEPKLRSCKPTKPPKDKASAYYSSYSPFGSKSYVVVSGSRGLTKKAKASFTATSGLDTKKYYVSRSVSLNNRPPGTLSFDLPLTKGKVKPGKPFSGSASYTAPSTVTGALKVKFLGTGKVNTMASGYSADLWIYRPGMIMGLGQSIARYRVDEAQKKFHLDSIAG